MTEPAELEARMRRAVRRLVQCVHAEGFNPLVFTANASKGFRWLFHEEWKKRYPGERLPLLETVGARPPIDRGFQENMVWHAEEMAARDFEKVRATMRRRKSPLLKPENLGTRVLLLDDYIQSGANLFYWRKIIHLLKEGFQAHHGGGIDVRLGGFAFNPRTWRDKVNPFFVMAGNEWLTTPQRVQEIREWRRLWRHRKAAQLRINRAGKLPTRRRRPLP